MVHARRSASPATACPAKVAEFHPRTTLLDYLREQMRALGTKEGCGEGDCGACTVALGRMRDGRLVYEPVNACILLLGQIDGADLVTVEDLAQGGALHPVQGGGGSDGRPSRFAMRLLYAGHRDEPVRPA